MVKKAIRVMGFGTVCALILSTAGFALGYFSASGAVGGSEAHLGSVALNMEEDASGSQVHALEWTGLYKAQLELEQQSGRALQGGEAGQAALQYQLDACFQEWWSAYGEGMETLVQESRWVSPGGFLAKRYYFVNESTIPVYFRIQKPRVGRAGKEEAALTRGALAWASWPEQGQNAWGADLPGEVLLVDPGPQEEFLYLPLPLEPGDRFAITFVAYLPTSANRDVFQRQEAVFTVGTVQLIQSQNNAAYLEDSWKQAASTIPLSPYQQKERSQQQ